MSGCHRPLKHIETIENLEHFEEVSLFRTYSSSQLVVAWPGVVLMGLKVGLCVNNNWERLLTTCLGS